MHEAEIKLMEKVILVNESEQDRVPVNPEDLLEEVRANPHYFVNEGGADGTFGHAQFRGVYGCYMPEIIDFAVECGGEV